MAAPFGGDLVFEVHGRDAGAGELANGAGDVEGVAPARIDVDQQRQVDPRGDAAGVAENILQVRHAEVRQAMRRVGDARTGEVKRPKTGALGE